MTHRGITRDDTGLRGRFSGRAELLVLASVTGIAMLAMFFILCQFMQVSPWMALTYIFGARA